MALQEHYTYAKVDAILGEDRQATLGNNTYAARPTSTVGYIGEIDIIFHRTTIAVLFLNGVVYINTGRYRTKTTADRIRRFLPKDWALYVAQEGWYYVRKGASMPYQDNHYLHSNLSVPFRTYKDADKELRTAIG